MSILILIASAATVCLAVLARGKARQTFVDGQTAPAREEDAGLDDAETITVMNALDLLEPQQKSAAPQGSAVSRFL